MTRIFVSHAAANKDLVDAFVDLLHTGVNVAPEDIFCSSLEGLGIPPGRDFVEYIRSQIRTPDVSVVLVISSEYLASEFCKQEAGAAWGLSLPVYPFLVPPVTQANLTGVLAARQACRIDSRSDLNTLRDDLIKRLRLKAPPAARWEAKLDKFLKAVPSSRALTDQPPTRPPANDRGRRALSDAPAPIETLEQRLQKASEQQFRFLLVGQTGVGKSSTVNSLFQEKIAPVGHERPTTLKIKTYRSKIQKNIEVIDTPGLCDDLPARGNDKRYISEMRRKAPEFHCFWFVTPLHDTRLRPDERRAIALIAEAFGKKVWERCIIVFTFADYIPADHYKQKLQTRTKMVREAIGEVAPATVAGRIPSVAVSNVSLATPDGPWYEELFAKVSDRIATKQALPFVLSIVGRGRKLSLSAGQKKTVRAAIQRSKDPAASGGGFMKRGAVGAALGAAVGGVPGAVVGGLLGGLMGLFD